MRLEVDVVKLRVVMARSMGQSERHPYACDFQAEATRAEEC